MKVASVFIFEPCSGWQLEDIHEYDRNYSCTDDFTEELCLNEKMSLVKKEVECLGGCYVLHLEMKSEYSIKHKDANQAHYKAEVVMYTVY